MIKFNVQKTNVKKPKELTTSFSETILVGLFGEQGSDLIVYAAANEFGTDKAGKFGNIKIPERSFLRSTINEQKKKINEFISKGFSSILNKKITKEQFLELLGQYVVGLVQEKITDGKFIANKPSTIEHKKSSHPLIDTGRMRQSITYKVEKNA